MTDSKIYKDAQIHIKIASDEKKVWVEEADKRRMNLSEFIVTTMRKEMAGATGKKEPGVSSELVNKMLEKMNRLEQLLQSTDTRILKVAQAISPQERADLDMSRAVDKVFWMLKDPQLQKKTKEEVKQALLQKDPYLKEFLETSAKRAFSALDLALERLSREEELVVISYAGRLNWKKKDG